MATKKNEGINLGGGETLLAEDFYRLLGSRRMEMPVAGIQLVEGRALSGEFVLTEEAEVPETSETLMESTETKAFTAETLARAKAKLAETRGNALAEGKKSNRFAEILKKLKAKNESESEQGEAVDAKGADTQDDDDSRETYLGGKAKELKKELDKVSVGRAPEGEASESEAEQGEEDEHGESRLDYIHARTATSKQNAPVGKAPPATPTIEHPSMAAENPSAKHSMFMKLKAKLAGGKK